MMDSSLHPDVDVLDRPYCHLYDRPVSVNPAFLDQRIDTPVRLYVSLIGYPEDINREILNLYHYGYDIDAWSSPQQIPGTAVVITGYAKQSQNLI